MTTLSEGHSPVLDGYEMRDLVSVAESLNVELERRARMLASQDGSDVLPFETDATAGMELTIIAK